MDVIDIYRNRKVFELMVALSADYIASVFWHLLPLEGEYHKCSIKTVSCDRELKPGTSTETLNSGRILVQCLKKLLVMAHPMILMAICRRSTCFNFLLFNTNMPFIERSKYRHIASSIV